MTFLRGGLGSCARAQWLLTPCPGALEADSAKLFQAASRAQGLFARSQQEVLMRLLLYEDFLGCFRSEGILQRRHRPAVPCPMRTPLPHGGMTKAQRGVQCVPATMGVALRLGHHGGAAHHAT